MSRRTFWIVAALIVLAAFAIRLWFVRTMWVPFPTAGDAREYLLYAFHLTKDGVFSKLGPTAIAVPDAFRTPGYPWLLTALYSDDTDVWFTRIYTTQALLGAATVACVIALAREWLPRGWALVAGSWMALQTHHIAATGTILSEVLFGFTLAAGLLAAVLAWRRKSLPLGLLAGVLLGYAYLVNPVAAFLPLLLLPFFWRQARAAGVAIALVGLIAIGGWGLRNTVQHVSGNDRAALNFEQGSWPEFHAAWKDPRPYRAELAQMDTETKAIRADRSAGVGMILHRIASDPVRYAKWYASKPYLLFDWEVRIGARMAYVVTMLNTPLDSGVLLGTTTVQWVLNPLAFALALGGLLLAWRGPAPLRMVAVAILYLTAVHVVLQAEPRYATPYRSLEILLAVAAMRAMWKPLETRSLSLSGKAQPVA